MAFQIFGADSEFSTATGRNINTAPGRSRFDGPPEDTQNLVITTKRDDHDPRLFELGDTYDVNWGSPGDGTTIMNAVVVRSDPAPGGGGIIVFEGTDQNGNPAQVIWTPDLDLGGWYGASYNPSAEPQFYTTDKDPDYTHGFVCFADTTRIKTPLGLRAAGALKAGDLVTTLDAGDQPLLWTARWTGPGTANAAPVCFAPLSIGNSHPVRLSQQHRVLITSARLHLLYGLDEALVPARALVNGHSIRMIACAQMTYVHLLLDRHHVLEAEGALCESLYLGDQSVRQLPHRRNIGPLAAQTDSAKAARPILTMKEAQLLFQSGRALRDQECGRIGGAARHDGHIGDILSYAGKRVMA